MSGSNDEIQKVGYFSEGLAELLQISKPPGVILVGDDNLRHIERNHKDDFETVKSYEKCMKSIPSILKEPDYIGVDPNKRDTIQYIKEIEELVIVVIRVKKSDPYWMKTLYPITYDKLDRYLKRGRIIEIE